MSGPRQRTRELVLASAGSGKTFRISSRIIELLASGQEPASVFASTFTRKAAGEILERVLVRLAVAASDAEEARELANHVDTPDAPGADPAFWRAVLGRTVRALHELDIGTLDSFFGRTLRSFSHDLGLPPGWSIADEPTADRLRSQALEEVFTEADDGAMVELVRGLGGGDVRRSVHDALLREVDALVRVHRDRADDAPGWEAMAELQREREPEEPDPEDLEVRARELAVRLEALPLPTTKKGTPRTHWQNSVQEIANALREGDWGGVTGSTLFQRAFDDEPKYDSTPIDDDFLALFRETKELARTALGAELQRRAAAMARLAEAYGASFDRHMRDAGALRFEDVTRLLTGTEPVARRPDLFYRLDGATKHVLLDEFQDTSLLQWRALRPLMDALLGPDAPADATASIVADPKQSIYGWRGAAPVVVKALARRYDLASDTLARSWRSSQVVLDAVNRTFRDVDQSPVFADEERDRRVAREWVEDFEPHTAAKEELPGHVTLEAGPPKVGRTSLQPAILSHAALRIRELHGQMPGRSIGVLARTNEGVGRLIFELRKLGVPASEEGGTRLVDSPAVVSVLALLRLADHPGDLLARYHVAHTPIGDAVELHTHTDDGLARRTAHRLRRRLLNDGYGATLAWLRDRLLDACDARDELRLDQLTELGFSHDDRATLRVDDFVGLAMAKRVESPGTDPVRVMTVHGSKGLEFDVVVLPELHATMFRDDRSNPPLPFRPDETGPITHVFPHMNSALRSIFEPLSEPLEGARRQQRAATVRDALSGLYVAMTRARHALHMIVPSDDGSRGSARSPARLLRAALADTDEPAAQGEMLYRAGDPDWSRHAPEPAAQPPEAEGPPPRAIELRKAPRSRLFPRRSPSDHAPSIAPEDDGEPEEARPVDLRILLGLEDRAAEGLSPTLRGSVVHAWLEAVEWIDDGLPAPAERRRILESEAPGLSPAERDAFLEEWGGIVEAALEDGPARAALSRERALEAHGGADLTVERELGFLIREGETMVEGIVDRLVVVRRDGLTTAAELLDFKTDRLRRDDPEALRARTELYAPQLRAYRRAVARLYGLDPDRVRSRVLFLVPGVVRDVE